MHQIVYILLCNDGTRYTGCTGNLDERLIRHQKGYVDSTKDKLPVSLIFYCAFTDKIKAFFMPAAPVPDLKQKYK